MRELSSTVVSGLRSSVSVPHSAAPSATNSNPRDDFICAHLKKPGTENSVHGFDTCMIDNATQGTELSVPGFFQHTLEGRICHGPSPFWEAREPKAPASL